MTEIDKAELLYACEKVLSKVGLSLLRELMSEHDRLKTGNFTKEEINEICHNLHGTVSAQEFADGCAVEQIKLYGRAPDRESRDLATALNADLVKEKQQLREQLDTAINLRDTYLLELQGCRIALEQAFRDRAASSREVRSNRAADRVGD